MHKRFDPCVVGGLLVLTDEAWDEMQDTAILYALVNPQTVGAQQP